MFYILKVITQMKVRHETFIKLINIVYFIKKGRIKLYVDVNENDNDA